jgi:hypothetical protein
MAQKVYVPVNNGPVSPFSPDVGQGSGFSSSLPLPQGILADGSLDKEMVHRMYMDGDFNKVENTLEYYRAHHDPLSNADKIVVYKYLGVIYSARPDTRAKGEGYLFSLLQMVPTITLLDMYIGDAVESIVSGVRLRYQVMEKEYGKEVRPPTPAFVPEQSFPEPAMAQAAPAPAPIQPVPPPSQPLRPVAQPYMIGPAAQFRKPMKPEASSAGEKPASQKPRNNHWLAWTVAGAAAAGTAVAVYLMVSDPEPDKEQYTLERP